MLESLNYSFRNPKKHNLSNLPHQTVEKLQKNHGVLRGRWRARLGILRVKQNGCSIYLGISPAIAEPEPEFSSSQESDLFHYRFATDWRWLSNLASVEIRVVIGPSDDCPFFSFQLCWCSPTLSQYDCNRSILSKVIFSFEYDMMAEVHPVIAYWYVHIRLRPDFVFKGATGNIRGRTEFD